MKTEDQRIAIARVLGWTSRLVPSTTDGADNPYQEMQHTWWKDPKTGREPTFPPDYPSDLNAMQIAEKWLDSETGYLSVNCHIRTYWLTLMEMLNPEVELWDNGTFLGNWGHAIEVGRATAAQRAEAFLRTLGLWKEAA